MKYELSKTKEKERSFFDRRGFGLVEVVIGVSILAFAFLGFLGSYNMYVAKSLANTKAIKGAYLLEEGVEALRVMRDTGWASSITPLSTSATYYFYFNNWISNTKFRCSHYQSNEIE